MRNSFNFVARQLAHIPAPARPFVITVFVVIALLFVTHFAGTAHRAIDRSIFNRQTAPVAQRAEAAHADSLSHELAADDAASSQTELDARFREIEARLSSQTHTARRSNRFAADSRRKLDAIRQTPFDVRRPVDDLRRRELRAAIQRLYPELLGEGHFPDKRGELPR